MFVYEKKLQYPVKIANPNPKLAAAIISQYGGPDGELGASLRYLSQRYSMPYPELKGLLTDIGTEELGHLEMVGTIVHQLTRNLTVDQIKEAGFDTYFVDHTTGVFPQFASGYPWSAATMQVTGDTIADLTEDIKTRFLNSFEEINKSFKEIFVSIFGDGAHGELKLTDPEDVLNSGIEILAAPPGKVIKNLISLSGGEQTMVAITIYFAILQHRPTPFCMLDEVDAALDDVNVDKYITYLNQFSSQTQLMVITHRRGTIEGCKVLYGVFMQEKGVSRLLRRELADELDVELK